MLAKTHQIEYVNIIGRYKIEYEFDEQIEEGVIISRNSTEIIIYENWQ